VGLFIWVGLLSLYPTISVITWISDLRKQKPPTLTTAQGQRFVWIVRGELLGLALIPLLAAMLARGVALPFLR
jgi:putative membrane protein